MAKPAKKKSANVCLTRRERLHFSRALMLEETGVSVLVRWVVLALTLVMATFVAWASVATIDEVAVTEGQVIPAGRVMRIEIQDGGIVEEVLVEEGQRVRKGDAMLVMDPTTMVSSLEEALVSRAALSLRRARLQALVDEREPDYSGVEEKYLDLAEEQMRLHRQTLESMAIKRKILQNQIKQYEAEISEINTRERTLKQQFALIQEEYATYEELFDQGLVGKTEFFSLRRQFLQVQDSIHQVPIRRIQVTERLTESRNRLLKLREDALQEWITELSETSEQLRRFEQIIKRSEQNVVQLSVTAPVDGMVHNLAVSSPGEVAKPGETLLEIVPLNQQLVVEVRIATRDIGHIQVGQPASVKFTTFEFARYGAAPGRLLSLSPTSFINEETGATYYKGIIGLDRNYIGADPDDNRIMPGMTVQADLKTGEKTLVEYLLKPIYLSMEQSFRER